MRIGIDLGGSKIETVVIDAAGAELTRWRVPTPRGDYQKTISCITELVETAENEVRATSHLPVGIGIPGTISPSSGLVKNANSTWLIGKPFFDDLKEQLGRPLRMANDANCFAVSEATDGAALGASVVFGVILGTGVGGGISINGRAMPGQNAIAGEWGHNPSSLASDCSDGDERPGPECYCGQHGCIETFLCGSGLARSYTLLAGQITEAEPTAAQIVKLADQGNQDAQQALGLYIDRLARSLSGVINILDPEIIVLGGGLSNINALYQRVPAIWNKWIFSDECRTKIVKNAHGDSSGVRGAAMLWDATEASEVTT